MSVKYRVCYWFEKLGLGGEDGSDLDWEAEMGLNSESSVCASARMGRLGSNV